MSECNSRFQLVESLYQRVLDLPDDQRADFLDRECQSDGTIRAEVEALLGHFQAASDSFLAQPAHTLASAADDLPEQIGRYRILGLLGEGGMGVVYRAEQENPRRQVALKVMRAGVTGSTALRRFQLEADILGRLKHPGIAQVFEAGVHDESTAPRPFFVMELIEGSPLSDYARTQGLDAAAKVALVAEICEAVHYAHQKGLIHRDLKPANILVVSVPSTVTSHGDRSVLGPHSLRASNHGLPKVLDFGVALAVDSELAATTMHTDARQIVGTLPYMSPEQVSGDVHAVDVRSDVYSLGVTLYELLCGRVPFDVAGKNIATAARIIAEQEPPAPAALDRTLRGDLDTIILKALEKSPDRRYASASELAADLRRFLGHETIIARPATAIYQFSKFARRNRGLVTGASLAVVVLVAGAIVSSALAVGKHRALNESERQRRIAQAVNEFLNDDILAGADPTKQGGRPVTVREVVDRAAAGIADRFTGEPLIEAGVRTTLSDTYKSLGEYAEATSHVAMALELYRGEEAANSRDALRAANKLGSLHFHAGRMDEAERVHRDALASASARFGEEDELTLSITNNLALVLERKNRLSEASTMFRRVLDVRMRQLGEEHKKTRISMNNLALIYVSMGRYAQAEPLYLREIELSRRLDGPEHPETLISLHNLAVLYTIRKQQAKAESLFREVLEIRERVLGSDHPNTLETVCELAMLFFETNRRDNAEAWFKQILEATERTLGRDHPLALRAFEGLSLVYTYTDRLPQAEEMSRKIYEWRCRVQGEDHVDTGATLNVLTQICLKQGKLEEAEAFGLQGYDILVRAAGPGAPATRGIATKLRDISEQLGKPAAAAEWSTRAQVPSSDEAP